MKKKFNRRKFILSTSLGSASLLSPEWLKAVTPFSQDESKVFVIIHLSGGNDGFNTVVPFRNDSYYKLRPTLSLKSNEIIKLNDEFAFNQNIKSLASLYDNGNVCILNNVGCEKLSNSHFRSLELWHSASDSTKTGWIGRLLDTEKSFAAVEMNHSLSKIMKGEKRKGLIFSDIKPSLKNSFLEKKYPDCDFGEKMKSVAALINSQNNIRVYYVTLPGFDTHSSQKNIQNNLLKIYADTMKSFADDLKSAGRWKDTLVMTFSEFGRDIKENPYEGTEHGNSNTLFLTGGNLKRAGILNELSCIKVDFRNVYGTILNNWLKTEANYIPGKPHELIDFV